MKMLTRAGLALSVILLHACIGPDALPAATVQLPAGYYAPGVSVGYGALNGTFVPIDGTHGLPVTCLSGCGGGGGGGGSGLGGTATAAAPSYTEGSTLANMSFDLAGNLRTVAVQGGSWVVSLQGTIPLPSGAATSAAQSSAQTTLSTIASNTSGIATSSNQGTANTSLGSIDTKLTGVATSANQTTANTNLNTISTNIGAQSDAAWASGNGSMVALLKAIATAQQAVATAATDTTPSAVAPTPATGSGRVLSAAASTNATSIKTSAGTMLGIQGCNVRTSIVYLKLYNKASSPTVGTDTPVKVLALPPGSSSGCSAFAYDFPRGVSFATGIAMAMTTGYADADTGALTAGDVVGLSVDYQ